MAQGHASATRNLGVLYVLGQGVIVRPMSDVIGFCPPLVSTDAQVDQMVDALAAVV